MMVCESFGGGVFTYVSQLCNDMCEDFELYLVYSVRSQTPKDYKKKLNSKIKLIEIEEFGNLKKIFKTIKMLRKLEKEIKPDIIHLHSSLAGGIGRLAFRGERNTVVYTPHGYAHILLGNGIKSKIYYLLEKILGKTKSLILTCCESEDMESKRFSKNTFYIETGINIEDLSKKLSDIEPQKNERFTVYSLGRVCKQKQPGLFNEIAKRIPEADFLWIGSGELENELTSSNIKITGWKSREEALAIAKGADVFVLCSLGEAIAMSLVENMFMKKLVLVSNVVGNKSVIRNGNNGYVCNSIDEYVTNIRQAISNFPKELPNNAYKDVINIYNTSVMKEKYKKFYNELKGCKKIE